MHYYYKIITVPIYSVFTLWGVTELFGFHKQSYTPFRPNNFRDTTTQPIWYPISLYVLKNDTLRHIPILLIIAKQHRVWYNLSVTAWRAPLKFDFAIYLRLFFSALNVNIIFVISFRYVIYTRFFMYFWDYIRLSFAWRFISIVYSRETNRWLFEMSNFAAHFAARKTSPLIPYCTPDTAWSLVCFVRVFDSRSNGRGFHDVERFEIRPSGIREKLVSLEQNFQGTVEIPLSRRHYIAKCTSALALT